MQKRIVSINVIFSDNSLGSNKKNGHLSFVLLSMFVNQMEHKAKMSLTLIQYQVSSFMETFT